MNKRLISALAIGAVVALGTTGCSMVSAQGTTVQYSPADGMNVPDSNGTLQIRNALIVADDEGADGNLIASIVNPTDSGQVLNLEIGEGASAQQASIRVPAGESFTLGIDDVEPLLIEGLDTPPGATVSIYFQSGDGEGVRTDIPVLNGDLDYLAPFVP